MAGKKYSKDYVRERIILSAKNLNEIVVPSTAYLLLIAVVDGLLVTNNLGRPVLAYRAGYIDIDDDKEYFDPTEPENSGVTILNHGDSIKIYRHLKTLFVLT